MKQEKIVHILQVLYPFGQHKETSRDGLHRIPTCWTAWAVTWTASPSTSTPGQHLDSAAPAAPFCTWTTREEQHRTWELKHRMDKHLDSSTAHYAAAPNDGQQLLSHFQDLLAASTNTIITPLLSPIKHSYFYSLKS